MPAPLFFPLNRCHSCDRHVVERKAPRDANSAAAEGGSPGRRRRPEAVGIVAIRDDVNSSFKRGAADGPPQMLRAFHCPSGSLTSETGMDLNGRTVDCGSVFRRSSRDLHQHGIGVADSGGSGDGADGDGRGDFRFYEEEIAPKMASMLVRTAGVAAVRTAAFVVVACVLRRT